MIAQAAITSMRAPIVVPQSTHMFAGKPSAPAVPAGLLVTEGYYDARLHLGWERHFNLMLH
jgi:hypothetical protein